MPSTIQTEVVRDNVHCREVWLGSSARMAIIEADANGAYVIGPLLVLSACCLSLVSSDIWSRNVGETSCGWRTDYSPDGRAFAIWGLIYGSTIVSILFQIGGALVFDWWVNLLWGLTWVCCSIWVPTFDAEYDSALRTAALVITASGGLSLAAAWHSQMWIADESGTRARQLLAGVPLSILAGWLLTAMTINWGIARKASLPNAMSTCVRVAPRRKDEDEREYRYRKRVAYRQAYARAPVRVSLVPAVLAIAVAVLSVAVRDPVLPVPLMWAIVNLRAFPSVIYVASLVVLSAGAAIAAVRIFM